MPLDDAASKRLRKVFDDVYSFSEMYDAMHPEGVIISDFLAAFDKNVAAMEGYTGIDMLHAGMFFTQLPGFQEELSR